jgi:hypothetical protein
MSPSRITSTHSSVVNDSLSASSGAGSSGAGSSGAGSSGAGSSGAGSSGAGSSGAGSSTGCSGRSILDSGEDAGSLLHASSRVADKAAAATARQRRRLVCAEYMNVSSSSLRDANWGADENRTLRVMESGGYSESVGLCERGPGPHPPRWTAQIGAMANVEKIQSS